MQVVSINNKNVNQSFGMGLRIKTAGMTNIERDVISHNLERINATAKDVEMKISLVNKAFSRYFNIEVCELKMPHHVASQDVFVANPTTVFQKNSPNKNIEQALFNNIERAKNAFYNKILPPTIKG